VNKVEFCSRFIIADGLFSGFFNSCTSLGLPVSEKYKYTMESYFFTDLQNNSILKNEQEQRTHSSQFGVFAYMPRGSSIQLNYFSILIISAKCRI